MCNDLKRIVIKNYFALWRFGFSEVHGFRM